MLQIVPRAGFSFPFNEARHPFINRTRHQGHMENSDGITRFAWMRRGRWFV